MKNQLNLIPRNGFLLVRMIRPESSILLPDKTSNAVDTETRVVIVAVAPDVPSMPKSNEPAFKVGDSVITNPTNFRPIDNDHAFLHHSAVMAIERSSTGTTVH